jgi:diguanylate cyclase (GGDEF)-like protein
MLANSPISILLASPEPTLLAALEPVLLASGARVEIVLSAEAALAAMTAARPPALAVLDVDLPGMETAQLLAAIRANVSSHRLPIVLISDTVADEWVDRLSEGVINDLILKANDSKYWQLRLGQVLLHHGAARELETLREGAILNAQMDHLTGVYNRETILSMLFRETDRIQRMNGSLCMILFDIDDFGHWNSRLGADACDELLCQIVGRTSRLLRTYDLLGRPGLDEFLVALPGCSPVNAVMLAERLRVDVFSSPFTVGAESVRLSACFGLAVSGGRSPMVVLREAEQALVIAKATGIESIHCFSDCPEPSAPPMSFLAPGSGSELLAW